VTLRRQQLHSFKELGLTKRKLEIINEQSIFCVPLRTMQLLTQLPLCCDTLQVHTRVRILSLDLRPRPGYKQRCVLFLAHGNRVSFLRLKQFTVLTPPNTTYCPLYRLYTLIKMSHFLKRYFAGKIFRYFSYDFSFYMKSLSTILSATLSTQQVIVTHLYVLSVSISMMRKHRLEFLFSTKE
jgi:hypothetical protein